MDWRRVACVVFSVFLTLIPAAAFAQANANSSISGSVKDASGGVLPGVTVEAASPALIEKVRTVVTDDQGQYKVIALVPGAYTVTFSLTGFSSIETQGVEVPAGFNATVNAELKVGSLAETITVTSQAAIVDVQNVVKQQAFTRSLVDSLPTGRAMMGPYASMIPGISGGGADVGGNKGDPNISLAIHGNRSGDMKLLLDGMRTNSMEGAAGGSGFGFLMNAGSVGETTVTTVGMAETETGGIQLNAIPKEGGNAFHGQLFYNQTGHGFQSNNLDSSLIAGGLKNANTVQNIYDENFAIGGPIKKDKIWFFAAQRYWGNGEYVAGDYYNATQNTLFYTPNLNKQAILNQFNTDENLRITWQAAKDHKINLAYDTQYDCYCHFGLTAASAPEAVDYRKYGPPNYLAQGTWNWTASNKMLVEAANATLVFDWPETLEPETLPGQISVTDTGIGLVYGARTSTYGHHISTQSNQRASVTYVTGSHSYKTGLFLEEGWRHHDNQLSDDSLALNYTFKNQQPTALTEWATPLHFNERMKANLGLYAQDAWTIKRLTLSYGVRYDYVNSFVPPQQLPAGRFVPARNFAQVSCVPCYQDIDPRFGIAYDLSGNGKTAIKASWGRYVAAVGVDIARLNNPVQTSVNSATRTWSDANFLADRQAGYFLPNCVLTNPLQNGDCGQINNLNFGQTSAATHYASDILDGFNARGGNYQSQVTFTHEILPNVGLNLGYFRTTYFNFQVTDNQSVNAAGLAANNHANYDPYCVTTPVDPKLPSGGGYQVCGLYDITPTLFGVASNVVVTNASHYGRQSDVYNGADITINARFGSGGVFSGGASLGKEVTDNCKVIIDLPSNQYRHVSPPLSANSQVKFLGSYPLPWNLNVSGTFQNVPGTALTATWAAPQSAITGLNRPLAAGASATASVGIIPPSTLYTPRYTQVDLRLSRTFGTGRLRLQGMFDLYNVFNANPILTANGTYGLAWLTPQSILDGRLAKLGMQLTF